MDCLASREYARAADEALACLGAPRGAPAGLPARRFPVRGTDAAAAYTLACALAHLGDARGGLAWLAAAARWGYGHIASAVDDPDLAPLRAAAGEGFAAALGGDDRESPEMGV